MADAFSTGPYTVEILSGNEQDRFEVNSGTYTAPSPPSTPAPPTFIVDGETVVLCPNATDDPVNPIPTVAPGKRRFSFKNSKQITCLISSGFVFLTGWLGKNRTHSLD